VHHWEALGVPIYNPLSAFPRISPQLGQPAVLMLVPSIQNAGHSPLAATSRMRASIRPYWAWSLPLVCMRVEVQVSAASLRARMTRLPLPFMNTLGLAALHGAGDRYEKLYSLHEAHVILLGASLGMTPESRVSRSAPSVNDISYGALMFLTANHRMHVRNNSLTLPARPREQHGERLPVCKSLRCCQPGMVGIGRLYRNGRVNTFLHHMGNSVRNIKPPEKASFTKPSACLHTRVHRTPHGK
jgi:hypothetical protein